MEKSIQKCTAENRDWVSSVRVASVLHGRKASFVFYIFVSSYILITHSVPSTATYDHTILEAPCDTTLNLLIFPPNPSILGCLELHRRDIVEAPSFATRRSSSVSTVVKFCSRNLRTMASPKSVCGTYLKPEPMNRRWDS